MAARRGQPFRPTAAPARPGASPPSRLTRRGRALLLCLLVALVLGAFSLGRAASQAATASNQAPALSSTVVQPGDTLWRLARRVAPHSDPRRVVRQIQSLNGLADEGALQQGRQLLLPASR